MITSPKKPKSKFLKISCPRCFHAQIIFGRSSIKIKCEECNRLLLKPMGGKTKIKARVERILR